MNRLRSVLTGIILPGILLAIGFCAPLRAQDDGSRAYLPPPENLRVFALFGVNIDGNRSGDPATIIENAKLGLDMLVAEGAWSYAIGGKSALGFVVLPYGHISGTIETEQGDLRQSAQGIGDFAFGTMITLHGSPPMAIKDYVAYKPSTSLGVLLKVMAPTGQYSNDQPINIGGNRWMLQVGFPFTVYSGSSLADPELLTFELMPSVSVFTDNDDPFGAERTSQDAIYRLEGHIAKSFSAKTMASLDALYSVGGATETDGAAAGGSQRALSLGITYSYSPSPKNNFKFTYGKVVHRNDVGMDGDMLRLIWTKPL
jgi:hypothetical protein